MDTMGLERRKWRRYLCGLTAFSRVIGSPGEPRWPAQVLDLAAGGVRLVLARRLEPGTPLTVQLIDSKRRFSCTVRATVVYTRPHTAEQWVAGCSFAYPLGAEASRAFLAAG